MKIFVEVDSEDCRQIVGALIMAYGRSPLISHFEEAIEISGFENQEWAFVTKDQVQ